MGDSVVITCAITGSASREDGNPNLPYTPEEMANEARRAVDAGASVIHLHGRDPVTGTPSHDVGHFGEALAAIRAAAPEALVNMSTGGGAPLEERVRPVVRHRPEIATCSLGAYNYAAWSADGRGLKSDRVVGTTFGAIQETLATFATEGVSADLECYDLGHVDNLAVLGRLGGPMPHFDVSFVLGVVGNLAADARNLCALTERLGPSRNWTAIVIDRQRHWQVLATAVGLGGWVRVGFEDCHWLDPDTPATSNGQLVDRVVKLIRDAGRTVAEPSQARSILAPAQ